MTEHDGFDQQRDQLPEYVHGGLSPAQAQQVRERLATDPDFAAELALLQSARAALEPAPTVDVARIVAALPAPTQPRLVGRIEPRRWWVVPRWQLAAAATTVLVAGLSYATLRAPTAAVPAGDDGVVRTVATDTPRTSAAGAAVAPRGVSFGGGLSDLDESQLKTLLQDLERLEALPLVEPDEITTGTSGATGSTGEPLTQD